MMRSLRARFALSLGLPLLLASGLAFALSGLLSVQRLDAEFPTAKERQLRFYAGLVAEPMWNFDGRTIEALLGLMLQDADAVAVELRDEGGHLVARAGAVASPPGVHRFERVVTYNDLHIDRSIGRITLVARNVQAAEAMVGEAMRFALVAGIVVAIALVVTYIALARLVLRPIDAFRKAIVAGDSSGRPQPVV